METTIFTVGPFGQNTYLLEKEGQAILIDPGFFDPAEYNQFRQHMNKTGVTLKAVCLTHAHVDHILGLDKVRNDFDVPVYLNDTDTYLWKNFPNQALIFGFRSSGFDFTPEPFPEQKNFSIGNFLFDVLYTPGHSPDHVSIYFEEDDMLIAGDALFKESIGRTDLYKGDFELLSKSIREKLYTLPDQTIVYPGHGPTTTIGYEKEYNSFVKAKI